MSNMAAQTHLHKVDSTYYFRRKVPVDLRSVFGREEFKYSLRTKNFQEAKRLVRQASADFDRKCQAARAQASSQIAVRKSVLDWAATIPRRKSLSSPLIASARRLSQIHSEDSWGGSFATKR